MTTLGIIGFGHFGQFMAEHVRKHFDVTVTDTRDYASRAVELGVAWGSLKDVCTCDVVVFAVPVQYMREVAAAAKPFLRPGTLVLDVASVKVEPVEILTSVLPEEVEIIATHPLFGPESGCNGIEGFKLVLCPVRTTRFEDVKAFCQQKLLLNVLEVTPEEHDREMAYVQGIPHFIGRILTEMEIGERVLSTHTYNHLLELRRLVENDSEDLFRTLQQHNPCTSELRETFLAAAKDLHVRLLDS